MIKEPELYIVGNKILMEFIDFGTPFTCSYLFDLDGKRYQLPSGFKI